MLQNVISFLIESAFEDVFVFLIEDIFVFCVEQVVLIQYAIAFTLIMITSTSATTLSQPIPYTIGRFSVV